MAWTVSSPIRGVCGNFRFKFYDLTDVQDTFSVVPTDSRTRFISSTNTTDNADGLVAKSLEWTGTADANVTNAIEDTSETFVQALAGATAYATSGTNDGMAVTVDFQGSDTDQLLCFSPGTATAADPCPSGNETYTILDSKRVLIDAVTADDEGTLFVIGD